MSTLNLEVVASTDDAHQTADGTTGFNNSSNTLECISHSTDDAIRVHMGLRFQTVALEDADTINTATIAVYITSGSWDDPNLDIYGHKVAASVAFTLGANDIVGRNGDLTTATTAWAAANIASGAGYYDSPDIAAIIEEITALGGWSENNALSILLWAKADIDNRQYGGRSNDLGGSNPKLDIDYTAAGPAAGQPTMRRWGGVPGMGLTGRVGW